MSEFTKSLKQFPQDFVCKIRKRNNEIPKEAIDINYVTTWRNTADILDGYNFNYNGPIHNIGENLIFILGLPRSGKSSLEKIISVTGDFDCYDEEYGFNSFLGKITGPDQNIYIYPEYLPFLMDKIFPDMAKDFQKRYVDAVGNSQKLITNTGPSNYLYIPIIKKMLPKAKIIICGRERQKHMAALFSKVFEHKFWYWTSDIDILIETYGYYQGIMDTYKNKISDDVLFIDFEDTLYKTPAVLKAVFSFINLKKTDDQILDIVRRNTKYIDALKFEDHRITQCLPYFPEFL